MLNCLINNSKFKQRNQYSTVLVSLLLNTLELVKGGYSEYEIAQLSNGNILRVLDEVGAVAEDLHSQS